LVYYKNKWRAVLYTVMNILIPLGERNSLTDYPLRFTRKTLLRGVGYVCAVIDLRSQLVS